MNRIGHWFRLLLGTGVAVAVWIVCAPRVAHADGIPLPYGRGFDIQMPDQKAIIVYDAEAGREDLVLSIQLLGTSPEAAWVVPVPSVPEVKAASPEWFVQLSDLTQPEIVTQTVLFPGLGAPMGAQEGPSDRVELLGREQVGIYDVSILAAGDSGALLDWLNEHGYTFPAEGQPILESYVAEGWTFVATRVLPGENTALEGDVQPLWFSFDAPRPVYPMRLTALAGSGVGVLIYVLADHRMEVEGPGFETDFAGSLTLEGVSSEQNGLSDLLSGRSYYVTKVRSRYFDAWEVGDLYLRQAANDEPYRRVIYKRTTSPLALCCPCSWLGLAPLGLVVGVGLARRYRLGASERDACDSKETRTSDAWRIREV